ncbi:Rieske (2Fe-2S) protein [Streptomyces sp. NPDC054887]
MGRGTSRRAVLAAGAAAGTVLAAGCGGGGGGGGGDTGGTRQETSGPPEPPSPAGGRELARTSDIPVGGGKVFADDRIVVTQPEEGVFRAFSAVCTHQGCTVGSVGGGTINCPCHDSRFRVTDASVAGGPARRPLPREEITVENGSIRLP